MTQNLVKLSFDKVVQTRTYTAIVLKSDDLKFAIFSEPSVGRFLQMHLSNEARKRPSSHDLMSLIFNSFSIEVKQVIITDVQDTLFFSKLFLEMKKDGIVQIAEIDSRPSDSIILAFLQKAPVFCSKQILTQVIPYVE